MYIPFSSPPNTLKRRLFYARVINAPVNTKDRLLVRLLCVFTADIYTRVHIINGIYFGEYRILLRAIIRENSSMTNSHLRGETHGLSKLDG